MDAQQVLEDAHSATHRGEHEAALAGFLWFHDHVLEHDEALYGVRLSFAIGYWGELASVYEPALEALKARRDLVEQQALDSGAEPDDRIEGFIETNAFNRELKDDQRTVEVLRRLRAEGAPFADHIGRIAIEAVIASGDAALARECLGDPDEELESLAEALNVPMEEGLTAMRVRHYAKQVRRLAEVLEAAGESDRVRGVLERALDLAPPELRAGVLEELG